MIEGFNKDKCRRRNVIAALRGGIEGVPIRFLKTADVSRVEMKTTREGDLPATDEQALAVINSRLPDGADPLTLDDVYIHFVEAANGGFIPDRFAFMSTSTLKNIASGAEKGVAFMNSHRTGGFSTPSELPFGKSFAGAYERKAYGGVSERALIGFYMLRGIQPNGANGPSTDDLHRMIDGGSLFDVSVGLRPDAVGRVLCNVCGAEMDDCDHIPGTTRSMSPDDQDAAKKKGVPGGEASYTLEDYVLGEFSGVYDGAVPGAGFSKGYSLLDGFSPEQLAQFRAAFRELMEADEEPPTKTISASGGSTGPVGAGKTIPLSPGEGARHPMNLREILTGALARRKLGKLTAAVAASASEDPEALASIMAENIEGQADEMAMEKVNNHPLLQVCRANNINDPAAFAKVLEMKDLGEKYLVNLRTSAKAEAIRAYGQEHGPTIAEQVDSLPASAVEKLCTSWKTQADAQFEIDEKKGADRKTKPAVTVAADAPGGGEAQSAWEKLDAEKQKLAKQMGIKTKEAREKFAESYLEKTEVN